MFGFYARQRARTIFSFLHSIYINIIIRNEILKTERERMEKLKQKKIQNKTNDSNNKQ